MKARTMKRIMNLWPPFLGAGISVKHIADDYREIVVQLKQRWFNRNYVGSHFGGSLYAMIDPFYMLMLLQILGDDYVVWDKFACIDFIAPGKGTVTARFILSDEQIDLIKKETMSCDKYIAELPVEIIAKNGTVVARATKQVYVRFKKRVCVS